MMNTSEVAIRCGEHAFTRLQKLLPQQDRLLPKIYQTEDDQYIIYWDSIHWFESSDKREAELVRAFNRAFDYLEECPFDQDGNILPGYDFESIILRDRFITVSFILFENKHSISRHKRTEERSV